MLACPWQHVHFTGIGGVGMSGLAHILLDWGKTVSGTDAKDSESVQHLLARGANVVVGHNPETVSGADLLVYSSAVLADNPERRRAEEQGIATLRRGEFLAQVAKGFATVVAVAGSHGKTTTTAMIAHILRVAGCEPAFLIGGDVHGWLRSAAAGNGRIFVTEVDESDGTQALLRSSHAVVVNVEDDHCWSVGGIEALERCFADFARAAKHVLAWDSPKTRELFGRHGSVRFCDPGDEPACLHLCVPGVHNRVNATLAVRLAEELGVSPQAAVEAMAGFSGVARRLTEHYRGPGEHIVLVEDYAHHPTELAATLTVLRETFPDHFLTAVFQPHRFERIKRYAADFARVLEAADRTVVFRPFAAWCEDQALADPRSIAEHIEPGRALYWEEDAPSLADSLSRDLARTAATKAQLVAIIGAGDVCQLIAPLRNAVIANLLEQVRADFATTLPEVRVRRDKSWRDLTSLGIGRAKPLLACPETSRHLALLLMRASEMQLPCTVVGAGSNFVGTDEELWQLVLQLDRGDFAQITLAGDTSEIGAGVSLRCLVDRLAEAGRLAAEFAPLAWIPGTVGGAARMNAGADGASFGDFVEQVYGITHTGDVWQMPGAAIEWGNRHTNIPREVIVTRVVLRTAQANVATALARYRETGERRRQSQPRGRNAGSVFRNPPSVSAGQLLDRCGCKGLRVGGCVVSTRHANFILAEADACEQDFVDLLQQLQRRAFHQTGVLLRCEVHFAGPTSAARVARHARWLAEEHGRPGNDDQLL